MKEEKEGEFIKYKCSDCGNEVELLKDLGATPYCCGKKLQPIKNDENKK